MFKGLRSSAAATVASICLFHLVRPPALFATRCRPHSLRFADRFGGRSSSRALQPRSATQPEIQEAWPGHIKTAPCNMTLRVPPEAIRNHSAYEASLSVVLSLLAGDPAKRRVPRARKHDVRTRHKRVRVDLGSKCRVKFVKFGCI